MILVSFKATFSKVNSLQLNSDQISIINFSPVNLNQKCKLVGLIFYDNRTTVFFVAGFQLHHYECLLL